MKPRTADQMEDLIMARGWYFVRQKGSHRMYKSFDNPFAFIVIPWHGRNIALAPSTQKSIMRSAGLTDADL
ncbi:MAG: type II toxin-antitoxin system HicA family toxin [Bacteroidales bacterium]|nr:type II toxin-antitoxin system HicA family toxin [Bacteroidales bacterium]